MKDDRPYCIFCELIRGGGEASICYEDSSALAVMDIQPVNPGHALVLPREHFESLSDIPPALALHLFEVALRLAPAIRKASGCEDLNIVVNSGVTAGQDVPHHHVHVIPRCAGDRFDIRLPFPESAMPPRTVLAATAARIVTHLRDPVRGTARKDAASG